MMDGGSVVFGAVAAWVLFFIWRLVSDFRRESAGPPRGHNGQVEGKCPKCGYGYVKPSYDGLSNRIEFKCGCGYRWSTLPLDAAATTARR